MSTYSQRKRVSQTQLALAITVIDKFYDVLTKKDSTQRSMLKWLLFVLEDQCKSTFEKERLKLIELIQRDTTLTVDEKVEAELEAVMREN